MLRKTGYKQAVTFSFEQKRQMILDCLPQNRAIRVRDLARRINKITKNTRNIFCNSRSSKYAFNTTWRYALEVMNAEKEISVDLTQWNPVVTKRISEKVIPTGQLRLMDSKPVQNGSHFSGKVKDSFEVFYSTVVEEVSLRLATKFKEKLENLTKEIFDLKRENELLKKQQIESANSAESLSDSIIDRVISDEILNTRETEVHI